MAKTYANIQPAFDTWAGLITKINYVLSDMSTVVLTTDTTTNGAITTGNAYVNGFFGANTLTVLTAIRGGTGSTSAPLTIDSNLSMSASYSWYIGNSTVNTSANSTVLRIGSGSINSTAFTGSANNSTYLNGQAASYYTNATNISTGTLPTAQLPATANISTAINVGANVNLSTSAISVGNSTVNTIINATSFSGSANNANNLGGISLTTLQTQITGNSGTAYTNAVSQATTLAGTAYTNAIAVAANATNITSGTLDTARLPATANISTALNVGGNLSINVSSIRIGNATVYAILSSSGLQGAGFTSSNVSSFNTRTGDITLLSADIVSALSYTPLSANSSGTISGTLTIGSSGDLITRDVVSSREVRTGNSSVNTVINSTAFAIGTGVVNSTAFNGSANNSTYLNGQLASYYTNATNISAGTLDTARLPATANISTAINVGANVNINVTGISIGNSSVNATINSTSFSGISSSANIATYLGNTSGTISNISSWINANTSAAYTNAVSQATTLSSAAYTNATTFAANATNISTGTLATARLPATANISTAINVGANVSLNVSSIKVGNATVYAIIDSSGLTTSAGVAGVTAFNTRTGNVTLLSADVVSALSYTPVSANSGGSIAGSLTLTSSGDFTSRDVLSSREVRVGNSTVNSVVNSTSLAVTTTLSIGNSTINTSINSTAVSFSGSPITASSITGKAIAMAMIFGG